MRRRSLPALAMLAAAGLCSARASGTLLTDGTAAFRAGDYRTAAEILAAPAQSGDPKAALMLGIMHERGLGTVQDHVAAERLLSVAAAGGEAEADVRLGFLYAEGKLPGASAARAADHFERAAKSGHPVGQINLGLIYSSGFGRVENAVAAHMWLNVAAANGHPKAADARGEVERRIPPEALIRAQEAARRCIETRYTDCGPR